MKLKLIRCNKIKKRILVALLGVAIASLFAFASVSFFGMKNIGDYAFSRNEGLARESLRISKTALENLAKDGLLRITTDQANLCNAEFQEIEGQVSQLASLAGLLWDQPGSFPRYRSYSAKEKPLDPASVSVSQYPKSVPKARVEADLHISSSMDAFFKPMLDNNSNISDFNVGTPNGFFRRFPWAPLASDDYDVRQRGWFTRAVAEGKLVWSDPYIGVIAKNLRINCTRPVYRKSGELVAVIGINVPLKTIQERIISTRLNNQGMAMLVDQKLRVIAREGLATDGDNWADPQKAEYFRIDGEGAHQGRLEQLLASGEPGIVRSVYRGKESFVAHAPVSTTKWTVLFVLPVEAVFAPVRPAEQALLSQAKSVEGQIWSRINATMGMLGVLFLVIVGAVILVARKVADRITAPVLELDAGARIIGNGDLDHRLELTSGDEIQELAETFNRMTRNLKAYIHDLTETTAAKERIESELQVATEIQASLLPRLFPPFPDRPEFEIYAVMDPAKEVGGDFYDFFFIDDKNLCVLIADVADKGVPAALYMMVAKTLLKTEAQRGLEPDEILSRVNNVLADGNENCMFVTVFCALLNTETGELRFANAGHNPPLFSGGERGVHYLKVKAGLVLGPMPGSEYHTERITLQEGEMLFLYTDGVTEAKNPASEMFGEDRLLETVTSGRTGNVQEIIQAVRARVGKFADGAPQSDDITMLAVQFSGRAAPLPKDLA